MEIMGASNFDEEWESLGKIMFSNGDNINPNLVGFYDHESSFFPTNFFHSVSQESCNSSEMEGAIFPIYNGNYENNIYLQPPNGVNFLHDNNVINNDYSLQVEPVFPDNVVGEILQLKVETGSDHLCEEMQLMKRKYEGNSPENPKKKSRDPRNQAQKNKRGNKKVIEADNNDEEEKSGGFNIQSSSSCGISEDDYPNNASQEVLNGGRSTSDQSKGSASSLNSNGKARASDPQSVYARRRRERINERLRTLQNLVPNGTKVDISTMLEEAVQYVKFLQLQIKLLSSDDLWMYAPIAYNGMDIGMYQKISPNLCSLQN